MRKVNSIELLKLLVKDYHSFVMKAIENSLPDEVAPGIPTDKEKMMQIVAIPDLTGLRDKIRAVYNFDYYASCMVVEAGKIELNEKLFDSQVDTKYRIYATKKQTVVLEKLELFTDSLNSINSQSNGRALTGSEQGIRILIQHLFKVDSEIGELVLNERIAASWVNENC